MTIKVKMKMLTGHSAVDEEVGGYMIQEEIPIIDPLTAETTLWVLSNSRRALMLFLKCRCPWGG